jgi:POT family proton-dependent oligopeptide transporter
MKSNPITPQLWGHPKGLFYLFFAELWERFSFYGMRALLVLYMTKQLLFTDEMSFGIYAAYGSLVYMTPLIGGMIADKILGYRKSIILGGVLMAIGHFMLAIEQPLFFYGALGIIIVGNGFFKPNISSFVGELYEKGDSRREAGFTIFYMGINIGGWIAPLLCAWLGNAYGWHYGFGLAGVGMLLGLVFFNSGLKSGVFVEKGHAPSAENLQKKTFGLKREPLIWVLSFLFVPIFSLSIKYHEYEHYLVWLVTVLIIIMLLYIASTVSKIEKKRLLVVVYFTSLMTLFWAIFEQAGSSLTLFADRNVELIGMNAAQTNSINSGFIVLLAIPFSFLWTWMSTRKMNPSSPFKSGVGLILLGLGFVTFGFSATQANDLAQTPMFYLILGYFILTVGELFISPIGLSKMTELAPAKFAAFIMGIFFLSSFYGHFFAGKIAVFTSVDATASNPLNDGFIGSLVEHITGMTQSGAQLMGGNFEQLYSYVSVYAGLGLVCILVGLGALVLSPFVKGLMGGVE